jgi:hypothetical protein
MQNGVRFPLIDVFCNENGNFLADGFHRYAAHRTLTPNTPIRCRIHEGGITEARIFACGANTSNGLRRTCEDKRKAVKLLLQEEQCTQWSNRKIADYAQVSEVTVRRIRAELEATATVSQSIRRLCRDGRVINITRIGHQYPFEEPPEPEETFRMNADGRMVNIYGFDFKANKRCEACEFWSTKTGICNYVEQQIPSWTPVCSGYVKRDIEGEDDPLPSIPYYSTRPGKKTTAVHKPHQKHVRATRVKCDLFPENPELTACEIRHRLGEEFLAALGKAIETITAEN